MNANSVTAGIAALTVAFVGYACGMEVPKSSSPSSSPTSIASACPAPRLIPTYVPVGFQSVDEPKLIESAEWWSTWRTGERSFQVLGGISADRGDDPEVRSATVRGNEAQLGPVALQSGIHPSVNWDESSDCGLHQYAVVAKGIDGQELLRIADSLEEA